MKNKRPVPPIAVGFLLGAGTVLLLSSCSATPPQTFDTWDEEWEPAHTPSPEGWQCDGQPCTPEQLQDLVDALEALEDE